MKVIVLGGSGGMGQYAVRTALNFDFVEELVVADANGEAARRFAGSCGPKARAAEVDARDEAALARLFSGADAVLNTVGPFFRMGPPVLRAAVRAKVHYFDINDDWESTEAMFAMDGDARAAGITAVIGMGASPGISNMLAVKAMRELESVEEIFAGFDVDAAVPEHRGAKPSAATVHGIHQLTGVIRVFEDGRYADAKPMREIAFDYPGIGRVRGWTMGHPEAVTFPRYFKELRTARVLMTTTRTNLAALRILGRLIDAGVLSIDRAAGWIERLEGVGKPAKTPADFVSEAVGGAEKNLPPLFAVARGVRHGTPASVAATLISAPASGMGGATGVPLATALAVVRPERGSKHGVFAPEAIVEPDAFFNALAPLCKPVCKAIDELVVLTRSWVDTSLATELRKRIQRLTETRCGGGTGSV